MLKNPKSAELKDVHFALKPKKNKKIGKIRKNLKLSGCQIF